MDVGVGGRERAGDGGCGVAAGEERMRRSSPELVSMLGAGERMRRCSPDPPSPCRSGCISRPFSRPLIQAGTFLVIVGVWQFIGGEIGRFWSEEAVHVS